MVLTAEDIMSPLPSILPDDISAASATKIMATDHKGFVLIGDSNSVVGIVTEWDLISKIMAEKRNPETVTLKEIMSSNINSVEEKTPTRKVTVIMSRNGIRRILVGKDGKYTGVITSRDILRIFEDYVESVENVAGKYGLL
jgi:Predicted signal-transduction protein containing cAMP-binding and CBS domains